MRIILTAIIVLFVLNALALEVGPELEGHHSLLSEMDLDPNLEIESDKLVSSLRVLKDSVILKVRKPEQRAFEDIIVVKLPIVSLHKSCGSRVITALYDARATGGQLQELKIYDHRSRVCKDRVKYRTEVLYVTLNDNGVRGFTETESYFAGSVLKIN